MTVDNHALLNRMSVRLFAVTLVLSEATCVLGACKVPQYRKGRVYEDSASGADLNISIRLEDFAPERLICLAEALRSKYPHRDVLAFIFSSREAALGYVPLIERIPQLWDYEAKLHGIYTYNKEKHEDQLLILPDGHSQRVGSPLNTQINLPLTVMPVCRLTLDGRCLIEFQHIYYPRSIEARTEISGRVTFAGTFRRDGVLSDLTVVGAEVSPPELQSILVDAAKSNLSTWRFEPGKYEDAVRITYRFEGADSPTVENGGGLRFRLPYGIVETGGAH